MSKHRTDDTAPLQPEGQAQRVEVSDPETHEPMGYVDVQVADDGSVISAGWVPLSGPSNSAVALGDQEAPNTPQTGAQRHSEAYAAQKRDPKW